MKVFPKPVALVLVLCLVATSGPMTSFALGLSSSTNIAERQMSSQQNDVTSPEAPLNEHWMRYFDDLKGSISSSDHFPASLEVGDYAPVGSFLGGPLRLGAELGVTFEVRHLTFDGQSSITVLKFDNLLRASAALGLLDEALQAFGWYENVSARGETSFRCHSRTTKDTAEILCSKTADDVALIVQSQIPATGLVQLEDLAQILTKTLELAFEEVGSPPNSSSDASGDESFLFTTPDSLLPVWVELSEWETASPTIRELSLEWFRNPQNWKGSLETDRQRHLLACGIRDGAESRANGTSDSKRWVVGTDAYRFSTTSGAAQCFDWLVSLAQFNNFYRGQFIQDLGEQAFFGYARVEDVEIRIALVRVAEVVFIFSQESEDERKDEFLNLIRATFQLIPWLDIRINNSDVE